MRHLLTLLLLISCTLAGDVVLEWDASPSEVTGYNVYRAENRRGPWMYVGSTTNLSYQTDVPRNVRMFWRVTSTNSTLQIESVPSNIAFVPFRVEAHTTTISIGS